MEAAIPKYKNDFYCIGMSYVFLWAIGYAESILVIENKI